MGTWIEPPERSRWRPLASIRPRLGRGICCGLCALVCTQANEGFDWRRDRVLLKSGKEERGIVIESCDPERVVLLHEGNRREEIPRAAIARVELVRHRLAAFLSVRRPGLSLAGDWALVEDAQRAGLPHMARLQAYHVLLREPAHAAAHTFLGHQRAGAGWKWILDGREIPRERFEARSTEWIHRIVLDGEHFRIATNCGLRRALDGPVDLEGLYVWWMEPLGPVLRPAEDVDDPADERITFLVHASRADPSFQQRTSVEDCYYDPSGSCTAPSGSLNVARTYYAPEGERPELLFELGTEALLYSTLVLGRTRDEADDKLRRLSHWAEIGLGHWVALHCGGRPGYVEIRAPFKRDRTLDQASARATLRRIAAPHLLLRGRSELVNLVALPYLELVGNETNTVLARARAHTFVAFLIEAEPTAPDHSPTGREALWT